jgi:hypothetical protein
MYASHGTEAQRALWKLPLGSLVLVASAGIGLFRLAVVSIGGLALAIVSAPPAHANRLYVTSQVPKTIEQYNGATGAYIGTLVPASGGIGDPLDIAIAPDGNLFVTGGFPTGGPHETVNVLKFNRLSGASMGVFATGILGAQGMTVDSGQLYVASSNALPPTVQRFDATTGLPTGTYTCSAANSLPVAVRVRLGKVYVLGYNDSSVEIFDATTAASLGYLISPDTNPGGLATPAGMDWGPDGNLYIGGGDLNTEGIRRFNGVTGAFIDRWGVLPGTIYPQGVVFGPDGNLYTATFANTVDRFTYPSGTRSTFVASGTTVFPFGLAFSTLPDDGAACTGNADCTSGVCSAGICSVRDHYLCYKATLAQGQPKFTAVQKKLQDQFGAGGFDVTKIKALCNPAQKNKEPPPSRPDVHEVNYQLTPAQKQPKFVKSTHMAIDQFGPHQLTIVKRAALLAPSATALGSGGVGLVDTTGADHFECYRTATPKGTPAFVTIPGVRVADQFGTALYDLKKITKLCAPTNKNGEDPTAPEHQGHYVCYQAKPAQGSSQTFQPQTVSINNTNFGGTVLVVHAVTELCVPAFKDVAGT